MAAPVPIPSETEPATVTSSSSTIPMPSTAAKTPALTVQDNGQPPRKTPRPLAPPSKRKLSIPTGTTNLDGHRPRKINRIDGNINRNRLETAPSPRQQSQTIKLEPQLVVMTPAYSRSKSKSKTKSKTASTPTSLTTLKSPLLQLPSASQISNLLTTSGPITKPNMIKRTYLSTSKATRINPLPKLTSVPTTPIQRLVTPKKNSVTVFPTPSRPPPIQKSITTTEASKENTTMSSINKTRNSMPSNQKSKPNSSNLITKRNSLTLTTEKVANLSSQVESEPILLETTVDSSSHVETSATPVPSAAATTAKDPVTSNSNSKTITNTMKRGVSNVVKQSPVNNITNQRNPQQQQNVSNGVQRNIQQPQTPQEKQQQKLRQEQLRQDKLQDRLKLHLQLQRKEQPLQEKQKKLQKQQAEQVKQKRKQLQVEQQLKRQQLKKKQVQLQEVEEMKRRKLEQNLHEELNQKQLGQEDVEKLALELELEIEKTKQKHLLQKQISKCQEQQKKTKNPQPQLKKGSSEQKESLVINMVHGPTAFDEVRCELKPEPSAPKLARSALRTTGKLSVALLRKFLHSQLNLSSSSAVFFRCAGEDLVDAMTLGQLDAHIGQRNSNDNNLHMSEHIVLEYRVVVSMEAF